MLLPNLILFRSVWLISPNRFQFTEVVEVTFTCAFNYTAFPFDEQVNNEMLRHSLAIFYGEQEFVVFYGALLCLWGSPLSLSPSLLSLFFYFKEGVCTLAGPRACPRDCNKYTHPFASNKGGNCNFRFPPLLDNLSLCAPFCSG